jgi:hypothetical protein
MSGVHALVAAPAEVQTCRTCGFADPPPDPTRHDGRDHRIGTATGYPHCGRLLLQACARRPCFGSMHKAARAKAQLTQLALRLPRHVAGGANR